MKILFLLAIIFSQTLALHQSGASVSEKEGVYRNVLLPPKLGNERNSEGDFIKLKDGSILFIYTHFDGGKGDHASAYLASRKSLDGGKTWTETDEIVIKNEGGFNVMSVSLLRLKDDRIALFYLLKNSKSDCRPVLRFSNDEAKTWSEPINIITDEIGYYVLNNDRAIQLESGRLIIPVSLHKRGGSKTDGGKFAAKGRAMTYYSDDNGETWKRSNVVEVPGKAKSGGIQEPGIITLKDSLMLFGRTSEGSQYISFSKDNGETWSPLKPSDIKSPLSPASIERIPSTGDLLLIWNDNYEQGAQMSGKRTPFTAAISKDEGKTWVNKKVLESDPDGWYCYTAIEFVGDRVLLGHCAGNRAAGTGLSVTQITSFDIQWLYQ